MSNNGPLLGGPSAADALMASALLRIRSSPGAASEKMVAEPAGSPVATPHAVVLRSSTAPPASSVENKDLQAFLQWPHGLASSSAKKSLSTAQPGVVIARASSEQAFQGKLGGGTPRQNASGGVSPYGQLPLLSKPAAFPSQPANQELALAGSNVGEVRVAGDSIRNEQIEAALRSKPQRGRKRNNLNQQERLELTRTRNREHAKSTRIRKKARYQELELKEAKLHEVEEAQKVDKERRQSILDFLASRETHFKNLSANSEDCEDPRHPDLACVVDMKSFVFEDGRPSDSSSGLEQMKRFDEALARRLKERFGASPDSPQLLSYSASMEGIALSRMDAAFVEIDLVSHIHGASTRLLSAILHVKFAQKSNKILAVSWHTTRDSIDEVPSEPIGGQFSHPSVVSLDPASGPESIDADCRDQKQCTRQQSVDSDPGPGMDI